MCFLERHTNQLNKGDEKEKKTSLYLTNLGENESYPNELT